MQHRLTTMQVKAVLFPDDTIFAPWRLIYTVCTFSQVIVLVFTDQQPSVKFVHENVDINGKGFTTLQIDGFMYKNTAMISYLPVDTWLVPLSPSALFLLVEKHVFSFLLASQSVVLHQISGRLFLPRWQWAKWITDSVKSCNHKFKKRNQRKWTIYKYKSVKSATCNEQSMEHKPFGTTFIIH